MEATTYGPMIMSNQSVFGEVRNLSHIAREGFYCSSLVHAVKKVGLE
ncbi:hypothetical protein [Peribacillus butanolivorans]